MMSSMVGRDGMEAVLFAERARLGAWWRVAEMLAPEGLASERCVDGRIADAARAIRPRLPVAARAPKALLVAEAERRDTAALVGLCLAEVGWSTELAPAAEAKRRIESGQVDLVVIGDSAVPAPIAEDCRARGVGLLVAGGDGPAGYGRGVRSFLELHQLLAVEGVALAGAA